MPVPVQALRSACPQACFTGNRPTGTLVQGGRRVRRGRENTFFSDANVGKTFPFCDSERTRVLSLKRMDDLSRHSKK
jgi:hypothetical protein